MVKPVWNNTQRVNHQNFAKKTHPYAKKNVVPRAVLMKSGLVSINTARQVNTTHSKTTVNAARPMSYLSKTAHSTVKRPIHKNTAFKNSNINQSINTVRGKGFNTARPKVVVNVVKGNNFNVVKASAYYEEIDGGYVAFGGNPKGGKITGKCTIKTATKDETSGILKLFITGIENLVDHKVKVIRCDNGTEFKNREMNQFCEMKAEVVNTACYVQNRVLVVKPHNKTPYELFHVKPLEFSIVETRIVEENLHIRFSENTPNVVRSGPNWLFDIDALTRTMNYEPIIAGTQSNDFVGTKASDNAGQSKKETEPVKDYILLPLWTADLPFSQDPKSSQDNGFKPSSDDGKKVDEDPSKDSECNDQEKTATQTVDVKEFRGTWKNQKGNKKDERGNCDMKIIARSVTQGYKLEEGLNYDEGFAHVARIEAIRLFLAYASFKDFVGYQMDVKSAFLYGKIKKEVCVCQPLGFEDSNFPDRITKIDVAKSGLFSGNIAESFGGCKRIETRKESCNILINRQTWLGLELSALFMLCRHYLLLLVEVNAARHYLLLLVKVNAARHKLTTTGDG
ncbi:retrovirus-related pol polyprotein from transposon TNT 1-94 [Tanacetum coccineum]